jgi:hypothetical protein
VSDFNRADYNEWLKQFGETVSVPMSFMADTRIKRTTKNLYVSVLCLPNPRKFKPQDLVSPRFNLKQVKRALAVLRKYGYLPDEDAS